MKRSLLALLLLCLLLTACTRTADPVQTEPPAAPTEEPSPAPTETQWTLEEARQTLDSWLEQDLSLDYSSCFFPQGSFGLEEKIEQKSAVDGSFTFLFQGHYWDRAAFVDYEDSALYHYALEDGKLVCDVRFGNGSVDHFVLTASEEKQLAEARREVMGVDVLLPAFAEEFSQSGVEGDAELICLCYALPLEKLMEENNKLKQQLDNILFLAELDAYPEGLSLGAELIAERETLRPVSVRFDFSQLEPVLDPGSDQEKGTQMELGFRFDYQLAETIPMPEELEEALALAQVEELDPALLPQPGVIAEGEYRQPFFGIGFPTEGWHEPLTRDQIGKQYFDIDNYGSLTVADLLSIHKPYVESLLTRGLSSIQLMLEKPPLKGGDGSITNTPAEYMDYNVKSIPVQYEKLGITGATTERFQIELCGMLFEGARVNVESYGLYQTMLAAEKDGVFFTIFVTCMGADESEEILAAFFPLPEE